MVNLTDDEKLELGIYIEQVIREELQKIIKQEARDISQKIESRVDLETNINTLTNRILAQSKIKGFVESISKTMETYLRDLDDIEQFRDNSRREIIQSLAEDKENLIKKATEKTDAMIEGQKEIIKIECTNCKDEPNTYYVDKEGKQIDRSIRERLLIKDSIERVENNVYNIENRIDDVETRIDYMEYDISTVNSKSRNNEESINNIEYDVDYIKRDISDIESSIRGLKDNIESLDNSIYNLETNN